MLILSHFLHSGLADGLFFDQLKSIYPPYLAQALINNIKDKTIYYPYLWRGGVGVSQLRVSHGSNVTKEEISGRQMWSDFQQHPYQTQILKIILNYFALTLVQRYFPVNFPAFFVFNWDFIYHLVQKWTRVHLRSAFILRTSADGLSK